MDPERQILAIVPAPPSLPSLVLGFDSRNPGLVFNVGVEQGGYGVRDERTRFRREKGIPQRLGSVRRIFQRAQSLHTPCARLQLAGQYAERAIFWVVRCLLH